MLCHVVFVGSADSEERIASIIREEGISELGTTFAMNNSDFGYVPPCDFHDNVVSSLPILVTLMMEEIRSSETSVFARATRRNIAEDDILHSDGRENLESYIELTGLAL
jgi:hypothetical protein